MEPDEHPKTNRDNGAEPYTVRRARATLWHAQIMNQTPAERRESDAGRCWCGLPTQGLVPAAHFGQHQCRQCAPHCALAAWGVIESYRTGVLGHDT
jgi:hypothetical protein